MKTARGDDLGADAHVRTGPWRSDHPHNLHIRKAFLPDPVERSVHYPRRHMWREGAAVGGEAGNANSVASSARGSPTKEATWIAIIAFGVTLAGAPACSPPSSSLDHEEPRATTNQSIVGGSPSTGDRDAIVLLNDNGQNEGCSGTLIAPNVVLTARHCVVSSWNINDDCGLPFGADAPASLFTISTGVYASASQYVARGAKLFTPQSHNGMCGSDIALLLLDKDVPNARVAKVRFTRPVMGETTTAVGYGDTGRGRRERSVNILAIGPINTTFITSQGRSLPLRLPADDVATGESTCFGDSGGPLLDSSGAVVAITSRGIDDLCDDRPTISTVLAPHEALIRSTLQAAGHPIEGPETNAPSTPNGTLDNPDKGGASVSKDDNEEESMRTAKSPNVASMGCALYNSREQSGAVRLIALTIAFAFAGRRRRASR